jgi:hypothetical protein
MEPLTCDFGQRAGMVAAGGCQGVDRRFRTAVGSLMELLTCDDAGSAPTGHDR